jgi:phosphomannomutase/phosphoglucomutase
MLVESFSGIRGVYREDLDEDTAKRYAKSYSKFLLKNTGKPTIVIGRDTRPSSESLKDAMIEVLLQDCDVIDVGINTTPAIEFAVRYLNADGGIIISASHNEPEYNGWKFLTDNGSILEPDDAKEVINLFHKTPVIQSQKFRGKLDEADITDDYISSVLEAVGEEGIKQIKEAGLKAVVDPNGGASAVLIKDALERLGVNVIEMNMELGIFKRKVEPNAETLVKVAEKVKENDADIGAGWDCDADRVELVDNKGRLISGNYVLALAVEEVLSNYKGKDRIIVVNDATSNLIRDIAEKHNAKVKEVEVGEINVVKKMYELNSPVGGEGSNGGVIIPPARCREGLLSFMIILRLMARTKKKLSELYEELPRYYSPREAISCSPENQTKIRQLIEKKFKDLNYKIQKTGDDTGGLKILTDKKSWLWYRASKTEAGIYRIISDSDDEEKAKDLLAEGIRVFKECEEELKR